MRRGEEFAQLVHRILVSGGQDSVRTIAAKMGLSYEVLYARISNRTPFSADEIRDLLRAVSDPRIVSYLLEGTPYVAAERLPGTLHGREDSIWKAAHRVVFEAADVLEAIEAALKDERIDNRDATAIRAEIEAAERVLLGLREYLRQLDGSTRKP